MQSLVSKCLLLWFIILILQVVHVTLVHFQNCVHEIFIHPSINRHMGCFHFKVTMIMLLWTL